MPLAYLIFAHKHPQKIFQLIKLIYTQEDYFVIHVDRRSEINDFDQLFNEYRNVFFLNDRLESNLGSYEFIQAVLIGLHFVKNFPTAQRIVILSEQDYPIKNLSLIKAFFEANPSKIFMECFKISADKWFYGASWRFPAYEYIKDAMDLYGGSQYLSFPSNSIPLIFDFLELNPLFEVYFKSVFIPAEVFFQTLFMNCGIDAVIAEIVDNNLYLINESTKKNYCHNIRNEDFKPGLYDEKLFSGDCKMKYSSELLPNLSNKVNIHEIPEFAENPSTTQSPHKENQFISFLTNKNNIDVCNHFNKLKLELGDLGDTRIFFHNDGLSSDIISNIHVSNPYYFTSNILNELGYNPISNSSLVGSNYFPLLKFFKENPNYDYYWYIEDDVHCGMGWDNFFNFFSEQDVKTDFISSHVREYQEDPEWFWWNTLKFNSNYLSDTFKIRSFNPLFRISNRALSFIDKCLSIGWEGHFEVLLPSLIKTGGFSIADFGGIGKYVLSGCENRFYTTTAQNQIEELSAGSMRYRPVIRKDEMRLPLIYHPVKYDK